MTVQVTDDRWSPTEGANEVVASGPFFVSDGRRDMFSLAVSLVPARSKQTTVIHRAWLQVWLAEEERRDRAVFELTTDAEQLRIRLPANAYTNGLEIWLSGKRVSDFRLAENRSVVIPLPADAGTAAQTLELFYWFSLVDPPLVRMATEAPVIEGSSRASRFYLQLILPRSEYLLWAPDRLTREVVWRWQGGYWGREANSSQSDLEDRLRASRQPPLPQQTNQYLFSSFGTTVPSAFVTAKRQLILLVLSGTALVVSLLLMHFPVLRHPAVLVGGAIVLISLGTMYPDPAILVGQAAAVGIAFAPVAHLLRWMVSHRQARRGRAHGECT